MACHGSRQGAGHLRRAASLQAYRLHLSRLYDRIAQEIAPQLNKADALLQQSREHPEKAHALLSQVCVISAYVKRRANLILLGEEKLLDQLSAMMVTAAYAENTLRLRIQAGCKEAISVLPTFTLNGGTVTCDAQDEDLMIEAMLQGGAQA